jgi:thiaminase/transcriptional activator TenA
VDHPFSQQLRALADPIWMAQLNHPFVLAIGDGTVDREQFKHWVRQDYVFLIEYARLFAAGAARAPDLQTMTAFANLTQETLATEMSLHRSYAAEFGISEAELEAEVKSPTTQAYTDFLLRTATLDDFAELVAALLPCMWGFNEIGLALKARGMPADPQCRAWVEMYASSEFGVLTSWCRDLLDKLAVGLDEARLSRLEDAFVTSSRYELRFWEMAQSLETWGPKAR